MKVPTLSQAEIQAFVESRRLGETYVPEVGSVGVESSMSDELVSQFVDVVNGILTEVLKDTSKSQERMHSLLEQELTGPAIKFFESLPPDAKFTPGFWSFMSFQISSVLEWRYPPNDKEGWSKNFVSSHSPSDFIDGFLPRIIVRGLIARNSDKALSLSGQDFWRSHILRVKTGFSKEMSIAFAEHVVETSMSVAEQRTLAKKIRSARSNVIFEALDSTQATTILKSLI
jgi:hypothetical protein